MPRDTLSREQIVTAAVGVLDVEGVDGLNVRRLGAELGVAATAMYWHIKNKDELIVLAGDQVWNEVDLSEPEGPDEPGWRAAAGAVAASIYAMISRHFWLVPLMGTHLIYGPGKARVDDHCLGIYEDAGFGRRGADEAAATVLMYAIGAVQGQASERAWQARLRRLGADQERELRELVDQISTVAQDFPRLRSRLLPTEVPEQGADQSLFTVGLDIVLDGLEARLATIRNEHRPPGSRAER
ncbi:TetR/AcrR family transcriptional regulator C-terminal domain-containing protein [Kribbella sp. NPDC026611]|uniref:TetR/AcrR family transcriptional regulator n=1 Tax=Kribbella sp. NPDC026611 TaxID=3154911 RepID=UPI0033D44809